MDNKRILFSQPDGTVAIIVPAPGFSLEDVLKAVPKDVEYEVVDAADVPSDRTFRNAWFHDTTPAPQKVGINIDKAKGICHDKRRAKRAAEFAPLDVEATIPAKAAQAEAKRQAIRDKHTAIQAEIDAAADPAALKAIIEREGL